MSPQEALQKGGQDDFHECLLDVIKESYSAFSSSIQAVVKKPSRLNKDWSKDVRFGKEVVRQGDQVVKNDTPCTSLVWAELLGKCVVCFFLLPLIACSHTGFPFATQEAGIGFPTGPI